MMDALRRSSTLLTFLFVSDTKVGEVHQHEATLVDSMGEAAIEQSQTTRVDRGRVASAPRAWAIITGLIAIAAALSLPFLPVDQDQASVSWPQTSDMTSVTAPLVSYAPLRLTADVPCSVLVSLADRGGVAVATVPPQSPDMERYGFVVKVVPRSDGGGRVDVVSRNVLVWSAPLDAVRGSSCTLSVEVEPTRASATLAGPYTIPAANTVHDGDMRPQVVGVFTGLTGTAPIGLRVDIDIDSRFSSSPTPLKFAVILLCLGATLASLVALHRLDCSDGRKARRFLPARWWTVRPLDVVVVATLLVWHFIGANTADDGYQLGMARASDGAGYMANYFRWFGVPEAPFGTPYYDVLAALAKISTASPWVRLPALLAGILAWFVISREVAPRLGAAIRSDRLALWTGAMVFLAFWLPYNNGLRPEPIVALGVLLTWCSVERAIATGRLLPAAVAIVLGALTLTVGPSGLICFAALIAGARSVVRIVVRRARIVGYLPLLLPMLACGVVILTAVFADQTLATVREMSHVHSEIGPKVAWFLEYLRYQYLLQITVDGSLSRRFGVFMLVLGLAVCMVTMLRRGGRIPGVAVGPSHRIIGITASAFALMMFTPTKWTHHFGIYAGVAGAVAILTACAVSPRVMRPRRNRALFAAAVFFALTMCLVSTNGYWYVSSWGIPWWDKPPTLGGLGLSTIALGLTVLALAAAAWFHVWPDDPRQSRPVRDRIAGLPVLTITATAMVLFEVLSFAKAATQYPSYSIAKSNVRAAIAGGCGLADDVLVENDPNGSILKPVATNDAAAALAGTDSSGFTPNGVAADLSSDETESTTGTANSVSTDTADRNTTQSSAGTGGGAGTTGTNGSSVALPYGFNPATTPVLGSFRIGEQAPAHLTTGWYRLPATGPTGTRGDIIAIAAAGRVRSVDKDGIVTYGQDVEVEYGTTDPDGAVSPLGRTVPIDIGPQPSWRNLRVPLDQLPAQADAIRILVSDKDLGSDQWVAVTPPRVPRTQTLNTLLGTDTPVLLDWAVGLNFPCQNLIAHRVGVAQIPTYRILPDRIGAITTNMWQAHDGGGPLGWTQLLLSARTIPSYLNHDWHRDWGEIEQYTPIDPAAAQGDVAIRETERWGWWNPGRIITHY